MLTETEVCEKIIWSADVSDVNTLLGLVDSMPKLKVVKIDRLFTRRNGDFVFSVLESRGIKVFNDAKLVEIPSKLEELAQLEIIRTVPWMLNCMAGSVSSGRTEAEKRDDLDGLKRFAEICLTHDVKPCGVTVLTSKKPDVVKAEFSRDSIEQVLYYVERLLECGFTDVVCSPVEVPEIRKESRFDELDLNTPGVRPAGADVGDQGRTNTPEGALKAGATRLVIGRPLTNGDPAENFDRIVQDILAA